MLALSVLVAKLLLLLDVYLDTEGDGSGATAVCGLVCNRRVRGRDRRKPFVYEAAVDMFDQRSASTEVGC